MLKKIYILFLLIIINSSLAAEQSHTATIQITNKLTSKSFELEILVGNSIDLSDIKLEVRKCLTNKNNRLVHASFLKITNIQDNSTLFYNWIFSDNPSISEFYNQIYSVKLVQCKNNL